MTHSYFDLDLTGDCSAGGGWVTVGMQLFYVMDTNCAEPYRIYMSCKEDPMTLLNCPGACPHGLVFQGFDVERTSFGQSDNDEDGLPDATNNLDFSKIKLNRVMHGDTFDTKFTSKILTSGTYPSWSYAYAQSQMPSGNEIDIVSARVNLLIKALDRP